MNFVDIIFASLLANNLLFFHFFGLSESLLASSATNLVQRSLVLTALLVVAAELWWLPDHFVLQVFHLEFLRSVLLLIVLWLVTTLWALFQKGHPGPWPTARELLLHSFLVGGVLMVGSGFADGLEVLAAALATSMGYAGSLVLLAGVEHRLARERLPQFIQGLPLQLVTLGLAWLILRGLGFAFAGTPA